MSNPNRIQPKPTPTGRPRRWLLWLGGILGAIALLLLAGAIYELLAEAADARAYPPPGQMVDVGGYRLHINCTGDGSPTVVIEAGLGDWSAPGALCSRKWRRPPACARTIELGWAGASPVRSQGMPLNSPRELTHAAAEREYPGAVCDGGALVRRFAGSGLRARPPSGSRGRGADRIDVSRTDGPTPRKAGALSVLLGLGAFRYRAAAGQAVGPGYRRTFRPGSL